MAVFGILGLVELLVVGCSEEFEVGCLVGFVVDFEVGNSEQFVLCYSEEFVLCYSEHLVEYLVFAAVALLHLLHHQLQLPNKLQTLTTTIETCRSLV